MRSRGFFSRIHARLHRDERGFTMVEALVAGMILAIGSFAVAQALGYGLTTTGLSRQRTVAQAVGDQQMELARSLNYDSLVLGDSSPIAASADPANPDYWVNETNQTYDPTETGCATCYEPLARVAGANPSLQHFQSPVTQGNTTFTVYIWVTWVDSALDGLGLSDAADGNGDGITDENGRDQKRVTVVVTWPNAFRGAVSSLKTSSLFSDGKVPYRDAASGSGNKPPTVACPLTSTNGLTAGFTAQASDADGTVDRIDWDFGEGSAVQDGGNNQSHTYSAEGTYAVVNLVFDDGGATASNASQSCQVTVSEASSGSDSTPPTGSINIANGAAYTTSTQVTLALPADDGGGSGVVSMQFSDDGVSFGAAQGYAASAIYTLPAGDGSKTVYVRYIDDAGNVSSVYSDSIVLDTGVPGPPTGLTVDRAPNKRSAVLQWTAPAPAPSDLAGYFVYRRATTSGTALQMSCQYLYGIPTKCQDPDMDNKTNYEYYVVSVDLAGNQSTESNHVTA